MVRRKEPLGLDTLLAMNGEVFRQQNGNWSSFRAWRVEPTPEIPHGIRYNLTFHDRYNRRVVGFDNNHAVKLPKKKRYGGRRVTWDHKHEQEHVEAYEFESPARLMDDFWKTVERYDHD